MTQLSSNKGPVAQQNQRTKTLQLADDSVGFALKSPKYAASADAQIAETML